MTGMNEADKAAGFKLLQEASTFPDLAPDLGRGIDNPVNPLKEPVTLNGTAGTAADLEELTSSK